MIVWHRPKKKPEKTGLVPINEKDVFWSEYENELTVKLDGKRNNSLLEDFALKKISQERIAFWKKEGYTHKDNLHNYWLGVEKDLVDRGVFKEVYECCEYGITDHLGTFLKSPRHKKALLGDYKYTAVTVDGKYCCWLVAN